MPPLQRYVSEELTHFVGRNLSSEEERYLLLLSILREGVLSFPPHFPRKGQQAATFSDDQHLSTNMRYTTGTVCFCDIPPGDLHLHMRKYGRFGLGFRKSFLRGQSVNPVFYVDATGTIPLADQADTGDPTRGGLYHKAIRAIESAFERYEERLAADEREAKTAEERQKVGKEEWDLDMARSFLQFHLFSHLKLFDGAKLEEDPDNFYMEREWRAIEAVEFTVGDVHRIIIPSTFAHRLRADVPEYVGQTTFSE